MTAPSSTSLPGDVVTLAHRDLRSFTNEIEKKALVAIAKRIPSWIGPDHLTALGVLSLGGAGICYRLVPLSSLALLGANAFLFLNWFGDSLDGTLARVRRRERPRYGFYLDHLVDAFGAIFLLAGLAYSGLASVSSVAVLLVAYLLVQIHIALKAHATGVFQIAFAGIGGTEARILIASANLLLFFSFELAVWTTAIVWLGVAALVGVVVLDGFKTAHALDREERGSRW